MYASRYTLEHPDQPCLIMASSGTAVTYREFEARSNRLAHLLRAHGLVRGDHYSILMENSSRYLEACGAGERSGLHYTPVNSHLTADEVAYIVDNSESKVVITSAALLAIAADALRSCPQVELCLVVDADPDALATVASMDSRIVDYAAAVADQPATQIADEQQGATMLYSSGTTGRPKGILKAIPDAAPAEGLPMHQRLRQLYRYREGMVYLSPAPLYHSAPIGAVGTAIRSGGTSVIMERFDPEQYLALVERYRVTHSQLVPTMFSRLLKLPAEVRQRFDLSSLEVVVHAAAPCPIPVKEQMIEWWGPIILEYYAATEGIGMTMCDSTEWLAHRGTVGKALSGDVHILDDDMTECPTGTPGSIWFTTSTPVKYFHDDEKSRAATSADGSMCSVGDVGYVDGEGYLYLTDRTTFMIISGGVNIYPQETENLLITHPQVADAAVIGVPHEDLGEVVKAVVQLMPGVEPGPVIEAEMIAFCRDHLSRQKCPRSIDFVTELPRLPTGKLYKRLLRDRYWPASSDRP